MSVSAKSASSTTRPITGRHVAIGFVAFFGLIAAIDAVLITLAVSTFGGLDTNDAYRKGLNYNANIAAERVMAAKGWSSRVSYDRSSGDVMVAVSDATGKPVHGLTVSAEIERPATNRFDQTLQFSAHKGDRYLAPWPDASPGSWTVSTIASDQHGVVYRAKERLWIAP